MKAKDVQAALVGYGTNCLWNPRRVLAVRNSNGVCEWEADLLLIHPSDWVWEVEIKVSVSDFRREFQTKCKKHRRLQNFSQTLVRRFFLAMPVAVWEKVRDEVPECYGVILLDPKWVDAWGRLKPWIERRGKELPARRATDADRRKVLESVYYRSWRAA
jgi:hypothetical protein